MNPGPTTFEEEAYAHRTPAHRRRTRRSRPGSGGRIRRPHVGRLSRRPRAPVRPEPPGGDGRRPHEQRHDPANARDMGERGPGQARQRRKPVRPRLQVRRPRRVRAERAAAGHGGADHALGHPEVGERRQGPELPADEHGRLPKLREGSCSTVLGQNPGYPFVRFYGIWNESNLGLFLSPQYSSSGAIIGPAAYAKLATAGYAGIKAGSPKALVAVGETSSNGRDKKKAGATDSVSPASSPSSSPRRTRSSSSTPGRSTRTPSR